MTHWCVAVLLEETEALGLMSTVVASWQARRGLVAALPLVLSPDVGSVGLVWRETAPGPALATVLAAFEALSPPTGHTQVRPQGGPRGDRPPSGF